MHPLRDSWLKIERAGKHLNAFNKAITAFESAKRAPYGTRREFDSERSEYSWYGVIRRHPSPNIPLTLGDFIHNLRSALDHLAYASRSIYAPIDDEDTQFPIFDRDTQFDVRALSLRYIKTDIRDHMETLQPYHGLDDRERRFLRILRDLSNLDKHRRIALVAAFVKMTSYLVILNTGEDIHGGFEQMTRGIFNDGDILAKAGTGANDQPQFIPRFAFEVALGERGLPGFGVPIIELTADIYSYTRFDLIPSFSRFFAQSDSPFES